MKPFEDRYKAAIGHSSRAPDVKAMIAEVKDRLAALEARLADLRMVVKDPGISSEVAAEANRELQDSTFAAERLAEAEKRLGERMVEIEAAAQRRAADEERQNLIAETDTLAAEVREKWPAMERQFVDLLTRLKTNANAIDEYNRSQDRQARLLNAERQARGLTGANWPGKPYDAIPLWQSKLQAFADKQPAWPRDVERERVLADIAEREDARIRAAAKATTPEAIAAREAAEEASYSRYAVTQTTGGMIVNVPHRYGRSGVQSGVDPVGFSMNSVQAREAREMGLTLKPAPADLPITGEANARRTVNRARGR